MSPSIAPNSERMGSPARRWVVAVPMLLVGYPLAIAWALTTGRRDIALALSLFSLAVLVLASPHRWRAASACVLAATAAAAIMAGLGSQLSFLPPVIVNLTLMALFGATLRSGSEPLISRFARFERGTLEPDLLRYSRSLTWLWTMFFLVMAAVSIVLAAASWTAAWTWFTAVGNWVCVGALFGGEYLYRRMHFSHYTHATPLQLLRIIRGRSISGWKT